MSNQRRLEANTKTTAYYDIETMYRDGSRYLVVGLVATPEGETTVCVGAGETKDEAAADALEGIQYDG